MPSSVDSAYRKRSRSGRRLDEIIVSLLERVEEDTAQKLVAEFTDHGRHQRETGGVQEELMPYIPTLEPPAVACPYFQKGVA